MIIEKLLNIVLSLPGLSKLELATATVDNIVTVLSSINFLNNFINLHDAFLAAVACIVVASVCSLIKLVLILIP
jgi:hypothetical protein